MENNQIANLIVVFTNEIIEFIFDNDIQFINCVIDDDLKMLDIYFANDNDLSEKDVENIFVQFFIKFKERYKILKYDLDFEEFSCTILLDRNYDYKLNND